MPLTDMKLRALKASPLAGKHGDRDGLFLRIDAKNRMYWQWRIRTPQGETVVSYGTYPEVGLAEARERHRQARQQVRDGIDRASPVGCPLAGRHPSPESSTVLRSASHGAATAARCGNQDTDT